MHAASAKRSPSEAGAGRGAGWPHREADDPAPRQGAAQRIGTATPWRFVRLAWLAWGWRGAGMVLTRGAGVVLTRGADAWG